MSDASNSFAYHAQTPEGQTLTGTIDANDVEQASKMLLALRLRVVQIEPVVTAAAVKPKPLRGDDFFAFNQQLTHLTRAGLPIERGLKLIAQDMRSGRLSETVRQIADEMEKGTPLDQAFEKHSRQFPPLYSKLVAAGVATGNLPGMLLNLGRHMEMVYRLRAMLWRAFAYPLSVLAALIAVMVFLGIFVIPKFEQLFKDFGTNLPPITRFLLLAPLWMPYFAGLMILLFIGIPFLWQILRLTGGDRAATDRLLLPLPLVGSILRRNMIARWCDAVRLGIGAGLDLPRSIELAGEAIGSPTLRRDGQELIKSLESGQSLDSRTGSTILLPPTVPAAMAFASSSPGHELAATLGTLSEMYQQQAEVRLGMIPALLTPVMIILVACVIGFVIVGLFYPLILMIRHLSGG
jgi:type IV pilus assembly protein PilC